MFNLPIKSSLFHSTFQPSSGTEIFFWTTGAHGHVPISGLNSKLVSSWNCLPFLIQSTSSQLESMVQPILSPYTRDTFMARNLSLNTAQSASGDPLMAITLLTMFRVRGITASIPAEAAPASGPNNVILSLSPWKWRKSFYRILIFFPSLVNEIWSDQWIYKHYY